MTSPPLAAGGFRSNHCARMARSWPMITHSGQWKFPRNLPQRDQCKLLLTAGNGSYNQKGLCSAGDLIGERCIRQFVGQVFLAGEEP